MKLKIILLILIISTGLIADDSSDSLWTAAQNIARANWNWVAGEMQIKISALSEDNAEMMSTDLMFSYEMEDEDIVGYYDGGKRSGDLVPENDQIVQEMLKQDMHPDSASILLNDGTWNLIVTKTGNNKKINKKQCTEFTYTCQKPDEDGQLTDIKGSMWLEIDSGVPVFNEQVIHPPVEMIKEIKNEIDYDFKKGKWTMKSVDSITAVEAMGQSVRMKNKAKFKKYWRYENED